MLVENGVYILTCGVYDDYMIEMVTIDFREAVVYFRDWDCFTKDKKIEVWLKDKRIGYYTEVIAKSEWDVKGELVQEKGLLWHPDADVEE